MEAATVIVAGIDKRALAAHRKPTRALAGRYWVGSRGRELIAGRTRTHPGGIVSVRFRCLPANGSPSHGAKLCHR